MRRVVVTGLGIVSSIGNNKQEVSASLWDAKSGITASPDFAEHGFRCQVWGAPKLDTTDMVDRRASRAGYPQLCIRDLFGEGRVPQAPLR